MGDIAAANEIVSASSRENAGSCEGRLCDSTRDCSNSNGPATETVGEQEHTKITRIVFNFHAHHRRLLQVVTAVILAILSVEWIFLATRRPGILPIERGKYFQTQFQVEINSATWVEWLQLEGIGPSLAHRIVADRRLNGPFESIDDIARVPGIGRTTLDRIRRSLTIRHDHSDTTTAESRHAR